MESLHHDESSPITGSSLRALWALGSNGNGQLGVGHDRDSAMPSLTCMPTLHQRDIHAHWHLDRAAGFAAAGGNHSALISCPDRTLWMAGSNDDDQCLRPSSTIDNSDATNPASTLSTVAAEKSSRDASLQFHCVADPLFLQALDRMACSGSSSNNQPTDRAALDNDSLPRLIRWRSVACGWAFTIGVATVEEGVATTAGAAEATMTTIKQPHCSMIDANDHSTATKPVGDNVVFVWGAGSFGELGLGPNTRRTGNRPELLLSGCLAQTLSSTTTTPTTAASSLSCLRYEVFKVQAGLRHVLALARDREQDNRVVLVGWGNNRHGQIGTFHLNQPSPSTHSYKDKGFSMAKDVRSKVTEPVLLYLAALDPSSRKFKPGVEIIDVACGQNHSLVLLSDGTVYSSGMNKYGQLGPSFQEEEEEEEEEEKEKTKKDSSSSSSSSSPFIIINTPTTLPFRVGFKQVAGLPLVDRISCGWSHNVAMNSSTSKLYLWGRSDRGQLGNSTPIMDVASTPSNPSPNQPVDTVQSDPASTESTGAPTWSTLQSLLITSEDGAKETIRSLSCGSEHTLALVESGKVYAWGWNEHGNCGVESPLPGEPSLSEADEDRSDVPGPRTVFIPSQASPDQRAQGEVMGGYGSSWILFPE